MKPNRYVLSPSSNCINRNDPSSFGHRSLIISSLSKSNWFVQLEDQLSLTHADGRTNFWVKLQAKFQSFETALTKASLTKFDYVFWGRILLSWGRIYRHKNQGVWGCLTSVDFKLTSILPQKITADFISPLTGFDQAVLGGVWPPLQAEFDQGRPSCFGGVLLLFWPALTFWLGLKLTAVDCRISQGWNWLLNFIELIWLCIGQVNLNFVLFLCWTIK